MMRRLKIETAIATDEHFRQEGLSPWPRAQAELSQGPHPREGTREGRPIPPRPPATPADANINS